MFDLQTESPGTSFRTLGVERRAWVRFSCDLEVACMRAAEDPEMLWPARVMNISCGGIGLMLSRRYERDTLLQVELQIPKKGFSRPLLVQVLHVTGHATGGWLLGCAFTQPLSEEEIQQLL